MQIRMYIELLSSLFVFFPSSIMFSGALWIYYSEQSEFLIRIQLCKSIISSNLTVTLKLKQQPNNIDIATWIEDCSRWIQTNLDRISFQNKYQLTLRANNLLATDSQQKIYRPAGPQYQRDRKWSSSKQLLKSIAACCVILVVLGASIVHADDDVKESYAHLLPSFTSSNKFTRKRTKSRPFVVCIVYSSANMNVHYPNQQVT